MSGTRRPFIILVACCVCGAAGAGLPGNVLVVYSNDRLLPANVEIDRGLQQELAAGSNQRIGLYTEFLDQPSFSGAEYERTEVLYLLQKYATRRPGVIVVAGDEALGFMKRHASELFDGVPVVHLAVGSQALARIGPLPENFVGIASDFDVPGTIQLALRLRPAARRLVVVTGTSEFDRLREAELRALIPALHLDREVEFLAGLPADEVMTRLAALGSSDVVYTTSFFRDGKGIIFVPRDVLAQMAAVSGAPIFGPYDTFLGTGVVGGRMASFAGMGRQAAIVATSLLRGAKPSRLRASRVAPAPANIDWRQVIKWNIDPSLIPADAVVHFREPTLWEAHRKQAIVIAVVIMLQAVLIAALLIQRRRQKRTADALTESKVQMSLAARAARISIWVWDVGQETLPNAARKKKTDPSVIPVELGAVLKGVHPADRERLARAVKLAAVQGEELDVEYRQLHPDGATSWIAARGRAEKLGERLTGVALDITARKSAEQQAEKDRSALTHLARVSMMSQLSVSIAHQLNQPLAAILGNAEVARKMLDRAQPDIAELKEICGDIIAADRRATDVIRRLTALYRRGELKIAPLNLNELICETLDLVRTQLMDRHVVPLIELAPAPPIVEGDRVQLQQVLLNLTLNAVDAMSEVAAEERRLTIRTEVQGPNLEVRVIDRGTGIPPENLANVFEAFWSSKANGIGVGLAICKSIMTAHHGTLTVSNNLDRGVTFCATWPVRQAA